jgi:hypothetical protein
MQINKIDLHKIIEDTDYYLVARKIEPIIIEEWEKTINFLFCNNFPVEIKYLNNEFQNKINTFINDILVKYRIYKNIEINNIKDQYNNIKNNLLNNDVKILYRLENNIEKNIENNIQKNEVLIKIMQTIENNLWNKEDKNIFFFKFDENMIGHSIINNLYETNIINKLYFIDFNVNDNNVIHKCKIDFKYPSINNKIHL